MSFHESVERGAGAEAAGAAVAAVEIDHATLFRDGTEVLHDLHLVIGRHEHAAILGPNGSGKSSLVGLISGEFYAYYREPAPVRLFGQSLWNLFELRHRLGIVSDRLQTKHARDEKVMDVLLSAFFGSVGLPLYVEATAAMRDKANEIAEFLGLAGLRDRLSSTLSSGEMRRLLVGRALVHEPDMLLLDEPYTSLDIAARHVFSGLVRSLAARGHAIVIVTHDISEIPPEIERVVLLKGGRVFADGRKAELLNSESLSELYGLRLSVFREGEGNRAVPAT
ncbi:MAG TPA: ATP-binding cassette domain-containing protein [Rectinemataceae bacterium]|nr:ATP-binding cassette domain-containing protein [Rectinemataceae bacterium]